MESTRIWLADTLDRDSPYFVRGLAAWLAASRELEDEPRAQRVATLVLRGLVSWLRHERPGPLERVARLLRNVRSRALARTCLWEALKQAGLVDRTVHDEASALLDRFFGGAAFIGPAFAT